MRKRRGPASTRKRRAATGSEDAGRAIAPATTGNSARVPPRARGALSEVAVLLAGGNQANGALHSGESFAGLFTRLLTG
jgi:hypothetical protein